MTRITIRTMPRPETPTPSRAGRPDAWTLREWVHRINEIREDEGFSSPPLFPPMEAPAFALPRTDCARCGAPLNERQARYCSRACYDAVHRGPTIRVDCPCGATVHLPAWRTALSRCTPRYCDRACYLQFRPRRSA